MFEGFTETDIATEGAVVHARHGGSGPPLLLLHGYPQTHVMWHRVAPRLAEDFTVVATDLRGYGDSGKPPTDAIHYPYSKRATALDQVQAMAALGFDEFLVVGHDRGARVAHRMALDHPACVRKVAMLDIVPTRKVFETIDKDLATDFYHWFFLIQPHDIPERLIGANTDYYLRHRFSREAEEYSMFGREALAEYGRCFSNPGTIHASCEDYRAAASIDLEHDAADIDRRIACPLLALWGSRGVLERYWDVLAAWRARADDVRGRSIASGHFMAEEAPDETAREIARFLAE